MGKKPAKCPKKCMNHLFVLKPVHSSAFLSREVQVSYCPVSGGDPPIIPSFNKDRKHYTCSFYLQQDMKKYQTNDTHYRTEHDKFCQEQEKGKSKLLQPKPRSKNQYCYVCKRQYDDYYDHIKSDGHKQSVKKNKYTAIIESLIEKKYPAKKKQPQQILMNTNESYSQFSEKEIMSTSNLSSSLSIYGGIFGDNRQFSSFKPLGSTNFDLKPVSCYQNHKVISSLQLAQNKMMNTPENSIKKVASVPEEEKKSPTVTKYSHPIILNSPLLIQ